jgi:hypothetical protein
MTTTADVVLDEDMTIHIPGRRALLLKKGDKVSVSREAQPSKVDEVVRRFNAGETFHCGLTDCPGYSFEVDEPSHFDPSHSGQCMADIRAQHGRSRESFGLPARDLVHLESLAQEANEDEAERS